MTGLKLTEQLSNLAEEYDTKLTLKIVLIKFIYKLKSICRYNVFIRILY